MWFEIPGHLEVKNHELFIGGLRAKDLAKKYGTPLYVYNGDRVLDNFRRIRDALEKHTDRDVRVHYAVKANTSIAVLQLLSKEGIWADTVSPCEARLCLDSGFPKEEVMFTGTSVSNDDLKELVEMGVLINIDSFSQLRRLSKIVEPKDFKISVRWNPGKGAGEHKHHTITAGKGVKFGIPEKSVLDICHEAMNLGFDFVGLHQHIGSNWKGDDVHVFLDTVDKTLAMAKDITKAIGKELEFVDFGGGPGIRYTEKEKDFPLDVYAEGLCEKVKKSGLKFKSIAVEPGRYIVGDAGILLIEANTVEEKDGITFVGVNAGFNTLIRPAFYGSEHKFVVCGRADEAGKSTYTIAGYLCESGDKLAEDITLPDPKEGDILAVLNGGAYGYAMASSYNSRLKPAEIMIRGGKDFLIRERQKLKDLKMGQRAIPN